VNEPDLIRRLELIGHATWPALEEEWLNGWLLRAGGGVTRRANSASPVDDHDSDLRMQVTRCEDWFAARSLPSIVRLSPLADPEVDRFLAAAGYQRDRGALIMTRPIAGFPRSGPATVSVDRKPCQQWLDLMAKEPGRGGANREVLGRMFRRVEGPAGFAHITVGDRMHAIGLGVVADDHVALFMMQTEADQRRRGLAKAIAAALAEWGATMGVSNAFLQVHPANTPAIALYGSLGFEERYEYWYRQRLAG
jgi:ribosomal protein S18 acetylase RimI-like enzyme